MHLNKRTTAKAQRNALARFIDHEVITGRMFKTRRAIAHAIGMTESNFSKGVQDEGRLTVEQLLRLACALKVNFLVMLKIAGREDLADIYKAAHPADAEQITQKERDLIWAYRARPAALKTIIELAALSPFVLNDSATTRGSARARSQRARRLAALDRGLRRATGKKR